MRHSFFNSRIISRVSGHLTGENVETVGLRRAGLRFGLEIASYLSKRLIIIRFGLDRPDVHRTASGSMASYSFGRAPHHAPEEKLLKLLMEGGLQRLGVRHFPAVRARQFDLLRRCILKICLLPTAVHTSAEPAHERRHTPI